MSIKYFDLGPTMVSGISGTRDLLTSGDVNNDGFPDIAIAHNMGTVGLYLNNSDQTFTPENIFTETWWDVAEGTGATSIHLADLDLDGNLDLIIPIYGNHYQEHMTQLYRGVGDGSFELWSVDGYNAAKDLEGRDQDGIIDGIILASGAANPISGGIADFNGDGLPDIVVSGNNGRWSVDVLIQAEDQQFSVVDVDRAGQNPQFLDICDFNEDGYPDMVVGALYNGVFVFLNDADGSGSIHQQGSLYLTPYHQYVITADFNSDGHQDIAARGDKDAKVYILYGDGSGSFSDESVFSTSGRDGYLTAADIDNDGDSDLVVASTSTKSVDLLLNDGEGNFEAPVSIKLGASPWGIVADDFDQDGRVDVAVSRTDNTVQILWNALGPQIDDETFSIVENSPDGTLVGAMVATSDTADILTYSITAGNSDLDSDSNPAFAINSSTGAITVNDNGDLDYEGASQFDLQVTVTDAGGLSGTASATIQITNIDEPGNDQPEAQDASFTLPENSSNATVVGTVRATDVDAGDTLAYTITAGDIDQDGDSKKPFTIDSDTGEITVNDSSDLDFEATPAFNLTVKATDAGGLNDTAAITINLSDVLERTGTSGDETISGSTGSDILNGLAGNDILSGGAGDDTLIGGAGIDRVQEIADVNFTLTDTQLTGVGTDALSGIERATLTGGDGNNVLDASGFRRGSVILDGGVGDDILIGPAMSGSFEDFDKNFYNIFIGGDGNDTLTGGIGIDCIQETGNVDFTLTQDQLIGRGTDHFSSMELAYLVGGSGSNRLDVSGFAGSHTYLEGGAGNDTLTGGAAKDWARVTSNANITLTDNQLSGLGVDTLVKMDCAELIGGSGDNQLDASGFTGNLVVMKGDGGDDSLLGRVGGIDRVRVRHDGDFILTDSQLTGHGTDTLTSIEQAYLIGGMGNNIFDVTAFTGNLTILEGGGGDDTLRGRSDGIDRVRGHGNVDFTLTDTQLIGLGTDTLIDIDQARLIGDGDDNTLDASAFTRGSVFLCGESGNDFLKGGAGNDILVGGAGDDTLNGGAGIDRLMGQGDTDFTLTATELLGLGRDTLDSIEEAALIGGPGDNTLDASGFTGSLVILEGQSGNDTLIGRAGGIDRVLAQGDVNFTLTNSQLTGLGTDTLIDINQARLIGYSGDNIFDASAFTLGLVNLSGGGGDDVLLGGRADDILNGGQGNDTLTGGLGKDYLTGGLGADLFVFESVAETGFTSALRDVIKDFDADQGDKVDLSAIDADTGTAGDQAFAGLTIGDSFSGSLANPGELYFDQSTNILYGNTDASSVDVFSIKLTGVDTLSLGALVL